MTDSEVRKATAESHGWGFDPNAFVSTLGAITFYGSSLDGLLTEIEVWEANQLALKPGFRSAAIPANSPLAS